MYLRGPNQIPWDGKLQYDYQLWIDSDIVFDTTKFWQLCDLWRLLRMAQRKRLFLVGIAQKMGRPLPVLTGWRREDFRKSGGVMNHETLESISKRRKPFTVDYIGFGWVYDQEGCV